jgi:hypothetical protein
MVVEKFTDGNALYDHELNNKLTVHGNALIGKNGVLRVDVPIISTGDTPKVRLYLRGAAAGESATAMVHGVSGHDHGQSGLYTGNSSYKLDTGWGASGGWTYGTWNTMTGGDSSGANVGRTGYSTSNLYTDVPQAVQIWIDGSEYTVTIDDPNAKGATMYDSANDDWGTNGTTAWNTGELDLSALISWTQGEHYIEFKETGGTGGVLIYLVLVN